MDPSTSFSGLEMLLLKLLDERDMYGYQMIETLRSRSDHTFDLKAGTLYPLLHSLEKQGFVSSYVEEAGTTRPRRYYGLTSGGKERLKQRQEAWQKYTEVMERVMRGGGLAHA